MSMKIVSNKDYVAGWLDGSIHDFLQVVPPTIAGIKYSLITCLDSQPFPVELRYKSPELRLIADQMHPLGSSLLLPTELLLETDARRQRIFFGFDEVCFFPSKNIKPKSEKLSLVGPARLNQARFNKLSKWMLENDCTLALGSGEGMNFVVRTREHRLVEFLLGYSIEQPDPSDVVIAEVVQ